MICEFTTADGKGIKVDAPTYEEALTAAALDLRVPPDELLYQPPKTPPKRGTGWGSGLPTIG